MTICLRWSVDATTDLQDYLDYILERNARAAARMAERVLAVEEIIRQWPESASFDRDAGVYERWIPGSRLKLLYVFEGDMVEIIAAFHTSRDPDTKPARS